MARKCIECGMKKGLFSYNYAGFQAEGDGSIKPLRLPGGKQKGFLCVDCANKRNVFCKKHGKVKGRFAYGSVKCGVCAKVEKVILRAGRWRYW